MNAKLYIFDLDGTLLDTLTDIADAANRALAQLGLPIHPTSAYNYFVGDGMQTLVQRIVPKGVAPTTIAKCIEIFQHEYGQCWHSTSKPYDGITAMLASMAQGKIPMAILSNKPHHFTEICATRYFPNQPFALVFGHRPNKAKKPDPASALEIAATLGYSPATSVFVGDTAVDMQTGKAAGMFTIGVTWGFRDRAELEANQADLIVSKPQEISEHALCPS